MIFYAYFGYPLFLMAILAGRRTKALFFKRGSQKPSSLPVINNETPFVSFIITAYNEEKRIEEKIKNSLTQNYPRGKIEIIVASDCSNDKTDEIVRNYAGKGVKLARAPERKGKENAQKNAVELSKGDILVFSDVATILKPDGISNIVDNFKDPTIGCVSSEDKFIDKDGNISGEGAYVKYEMFLRKLESEVNTLVGLSGSFFAARREVCKNWAIDLQSDFNTLLNSIKIGLKGISDPRSIGYYKNIADEKKEFNRKVRTVLRGISVLMRNLFLLNPFKYRLFSWQLFSHKLCRWFVPFFLTSAFLSNAAIMFKSIPLFLIFILQIIFYFLGFYYYWNLSALNSPKPKSHNMLKAIAGLFYFFITVNMSIMVAWLKYLKGERATFWEPSKR
jgi:cellulose synthase/poly-beta-1,6-N-acetylglucosamine synthase-like glycosyltransferase